MSNLSKGAIHVTNIELPTINNASDKTDERDKWWEYNVSEQFPIKSRRETNGPTHIEVGKPHEGCLIKTTMKNGKMNGESSIYSQDNTLMATLTFVNGIASGPCTLCKNGILFYKGYFVNGYREGRGQEYDENGNVVFDGYYKKGKKLNIVPSNEMGKGYWKELDEKGRIIRISQKDEFGNSEGFCYSYEDEKISRVSVWKEGKEDTLLKQFHDNSMIEYKNGKKVYEGGFVDSLEMGYPRKEESEEFGKDENTNELNGNNNENSFINKLKTEGLSKTLLNDRKLSVIVTVIIIILFFIYFIAIYLGYGFFGIGSKQVSYIVESGYGNNETIFELSNYPYLRKIKIGDECFANVHTFKINGLNRLKTINIGINSFNNLSLYFLSEPQFVAEWVKNSNKSKSFHILNCELLESIYIGRYSFGDFGGDFELKNLPQLQSIQIGTMEDYSTNFYGSSFVIRGIDLIFTSND